ncbi:GIY-YIG nuclease family protein [Kushneria aurantia]|uniref:GIY-YIG nuclease family protein n=1 Tax=Kushneria aurantia TaxID=504092 RepID=A0ABV6G0V3_9GAMM|nr:GIY-YIG nuclease family protein [Kushneria aurantia]
MDRLLKVGFEHAGHWFLEDNRIAFKLDRFYKDSNVLYVFVVDGEVRYVGKTTTTLSRRFYGYRNPHGRQPTNTKNNANILACLQAGEEVDIYVLPDNGLMHYGSFHLNLASGLEDSIIKTLDPPWNGKPPKEVAQEQEEADLQAPDFPAPTGTFTLKLGTTYYEQGFVNVPKEATDLFGDHKDTVEIYVKDLPEAVLGYISRKAQSTGAPRIYGRSELAKLFQQAYSLGDTAMVEVLSSDAIRFT